MQFNSYLFILAFLPLLIILYFLLSKLHTAAGKVVLILASLLFYGYADRTMLCILIASIVVNYAFVLWIKGGRHLPPRYAVYFPVILNICFLIYFKYTNFIIDNVNRFFHTEYPLRNIILPIGISFFTFQQIAYLMTVYRKELQNTNFIDYFVYIAYFPKLLMGPLTEPVDFILQLNNQNLKKIDWTHIVEGLKLFSFGLLKKIIFADTFANAVAWAYNSFDEATAMDWILVTLFYTFEIYFDFSGYSDMAVGVSRMLNINLPINFDSPYKAVSIRDFWKRWHISLTKFLTKYIYIPLGGNRKGIIFTCINTMIVFIISGIWHGADWTFILWGILHGSFSVFDRLFDKIEKKIFEPVRWFLTFACVNILWILFRSDSILQWKKIVIKMLYFQNTTISDGLLNTFLLPETSFINDILHLDKYTLNIHGFWMLVFIFAAFGICLIPDNNYKNRERLSFVSMIAAAVAMGWSILSLSTESQFVYFGF